MIVIDNKVNKMNMPHSCVAACEYPVLTSKCTVYVDVTVCIEITFRPSNSLNILRFQFLW